MFQVSVNRPKGTQKDDRIKHRSPDGAGACESRSKEEGLKGGFRAAGLGDFGLGFGDH